MTALEKKNLLLDCVSKAVEEIFVEKKLPEREVVETVFKSYLTEAGLSGLADKMLEIFNKTLESSGLVPVEYWTTKEEPVIPVDENISVVPSLV